MEIMVESPDVIFQTVYYNWNAVKADPDNNKFFDIAVAANAHYLVTNDAHFSLAKRENFPALSIISADHFLTLL